MVITVITQDTESREKEFMEKYQLFHDLIYNTSLSLDDILERIDCCNGNRLHRRIRHKWKCDGEISLIRRGNLIRQGSWESYCEKMRG